jgi:hypothetical protein
LLCPPCKFQGLPESSIGADQIFGSQKLSIKDLDEFCEIPNCPHCEQQMTRYFDPEKTLNMFREKFIEKGYTVVAKHTDINQQEQIVGMAHVTKSTIAEAWKGNEWKTFVYAEIAENQEDVCSRSYQNYISTLSLQMRRFQEECNGLKFENNQISEDSEVMVVHSAAISKKFRGIFLNITAALYEEIPDSEKQLLAIGELAKGNKSAKIYDRFDSKIEFAYGILSAGHNRAETQEGDGYIFMIPFREFEIWHKLRQAK